MWAVINQKGKGLTPFKYGLGYELLNTDFCMNGLIRAFVNNKFGFVHNKGEEIIPYVYDRASPFDKGSARVMKNGLWALINNKDFGINIIAAIIVFITYYVLSTCIFILKFS